ncbi:hypothetical protein FB550_103166 [Neobacillus bataviensis]|uniref:Uncharacterized protein n=1 Tax=Neobacillus bataviensis TaxID=220685 RepID=A0A561DNP8_9BACI|nr:hypothetical protein [Neobacillus bataviensis]TWE04991.1 hypothetical protein FB550_103166 [Neobacillus bataviensis]
MLSFEEKKAIFHSFKLKEKKNGNGKVSFVYPESVQKGQVLATQLHPSGNGYVIGKYMSEETIKKHGYQVDPRGWISIKVFSKDEIAKVIMEAIQSMSGRHVEALLPDGVTSVAETFEEKAPVADEDILATAIEAVDAPEVVEGEAVEDPEKVAAVSLDTIESPPDEKIAAGQAEREKEEDPVQQGTYEFYPGACLFAWMGLTLSTMEYGYLVWRKAVRDLVGAAPARDKE